MLLYIESLKLNAQQNEKIINADNNYCNEFYYFGLF